MSTTIPSRNDWIFGNIRNVLDDKQFMIRSEIVGMLNKSTRIFKYGNLPDTIHPKDLETQLQVGGYNIWKEVKGKLYTFHGGLGGEPNPYYLPTIAIIANPALQYNASLKIGEECVVMLNDHYYQGMMPMFSKYGNLLAEAELSLRQAIINARVPAIVQTDNDATYASAVEFFNKIKEGKDYGVVASKSLLDGITSHDFYKQPHIKELIEAIQYIRGSWYNAIGLNAVFNMKREAINSAEATLNEDILYPTIDNMLQCRRDALEKINAMYGTSITVELDSVWMQNRVHEDIVLDKGRAEVEAIEAEAEEKEVNDETDRDVDKPADNSNG